MYKISWDHKTRGVKLGSLVTDETLGTSPRPVFYEELDLLKMDSDFGWKYPKCQEPLLWCINKTYYYDGEKVFDVHGANLYDPAVVTLADDKYRGMALEPVDVKGMIEVCNDEMFLLESEAIEFIRSTYVQYSSAKKIVDSVKANQIDFEALLQKVEKQSKKKMAIVKQDCDSFDIMPLDEAKAGGKKTYQTTKIDRFLASFSGGKDSQVVLDLCTRAMPPDAYEVIYSDTGYELPPSLELYDEVQDYYHKKYPDLKFSIAKNHESVLNYWDKIGTPSDKQRWCCKVMKTGPLYRSMKVEGSNRQAKVLAFEGVRAEESTRRSGYDRIGQAVKHSTTINARPILRWNLVEIFLYLLKYKLPVNKSYRNGMTRVGCLICPFGSEWNEMQVNHSHPQLIKPFLQRIEKYAIKSGVKDVDVFIKEGGWKRRVSGNYVETDSNVIFKSSKEKLTAKIFSPRLSPLTYFQALGEYSLLNDGNDGASGEIKIHNNIYPFTLSTVNNGSIVFEISNIFDAQIISLIKSALYKSTYCVNCEVCEVECPTGALSVYPVSKIDKKKCIHCHKCLSFIDKGCIVANSLITTNGIMSTSNQVVNIDRYKNFGLREDWVEMYLCDLDDYWDGPHGLNEKYQIPALKCWLRDAEIIDSKNNVTELGRCLSSLRMDYPNLPWEIIWINLSYNSFIVGWFVSHIERQGSFSSKLLEEMIKEENPQYQAKTIHNAVYQLQRTLKESPIGVTLNQCHYVDKENAVRDCFDDVSPIAVAYSIYKYSEKMNIKNCRIADFLSRNETHGPVREFAISKEILEQNLRYLNSMPNRPLLSELNMGLDNISLIEDKTSLSVLKDLI